MTHRHFCDSLATSGNAWEPPCVRSQAIQNRPCVFVQDIKFPWRTETIALVLSSMLACSEHSEEQLREMGVFSARDPLPSEREAESGMFNDQDGKPIVGFCLWCDKNYYSMQEAAAHHANGSEGCPAFRGFVSAVTDE